MPKTWFVTGAGRGLGVDVARAALAAGDRVVAGARRREAVSERLGPDGDALQAAELDVTDARQVRDAVDEAVARFGGIDVLVNNAGYGHLGYFEETTREDVEAQFATNLFGVFEVTRAVLPVMRAARSGRIFNVSSVAGFFGSEITSLYSASKFALEGFSESLAKEVARFRIGVTIVEPGPFRTDFLAPASLRFGGSPVADYDDVREEIRSSFEQRDGRQPGDPALLAEAIVRLASEPEPPLRFLAGAMAVSAAEAKLERTRAEIDRWRGLSLGTDGDPAA